MSLFFLFLLGAGGWALVRSQISLTEWQRRGVWIVAIAAFGVPSFFGIQNHPSVTGVLWPFMAGIMTGELAWNRYKPKWEAFKQKHAAPPPAPKKRRKKKPGSGEAPKL